VDRYGFRGNEVGSLPPNYRKKRLHQAYGRYQRELPCIYSEALQKRKPQPESFVACHFSYEDRPPARGSIGSDLRMRRSPSGTANSDRGSERRLTVNLLKIKERQQPEASKEESFASFSARSLWLFCDFLSESRHTNRRLEAGALP